MTLKFRRNCTECGQMFFSTDRAAKFCPRCAQLMEAAEKQKKRTLEKTKRNLVSPNAPRRAPLPGRPSTKGEVRAKIQKEFELLQDRKDLSRSKIHGLIAAKMRLKKRTVAQALQSPEQESKVSPEQREEILSRYRAYVEKLERPSGGRRSAIAEALGIPLPYVTRVIRKWRASQPRMKDLGRGQRFIIEKVFFENLEKGRSFPLIMRETLKAGNCHPWLALCYLDFIHDGARRLEKVPDVTPGQKKSIVAGYRTYLSGAIPPEAFLHNMLAEKAGVDHKQVHKTLLAYRWERLEQVQEGGKKTGKTTKGGQQGPKKKMSVSRDPRRKNGLF